MVIFANNNSHINIFAALKLSTCLGKISTVNKNVLNELECDPKEDTFILTSRSKNVESGCSKLAAFGESQGLNL